MALTIIVAVGGVTSYLRLGSQTSALRDGLIQCVPGDWKKRVVVNVGGITMALVRTGLKFVKLEPQARAAVNTVRGAEVGVFELRGAPRDIDSGAILGRTDRAMARQGWERAVGVSHDRQLVAVYFPRRKLSPGRVRGCVLVFDGRTLVVVSARANIEPLLELCARNGLQNIFPEFKNPLREVAAGAGPLTEW